MKTKDLTESEIKKEAKMYNKRAINGQFDGDDPYKHFIAGAKWMKSEIDKKIIENNENNGTK